MFYYCGVYLLQAKEDEVDDVRERLRQQEEATRQLGESLRQEAQEQVNTSHSPFFVLPLYFGVSWFIFTYPYISFSSIASYLL